MILFFGPPGAGKSVQAQLLAAEYNWRWLSSGQLLRDSKNIEALEEMRRGTLVSAEHIEGVIKDALDRAGDIEKVILDGYPRELEQAQWLLQVLPNHNRAIELAIVLEVPPVELKKRLSLRGRIDDRAEVIDDRLTIYQNETKPILDYLKKKGVRVAHINGVGSIDQVHARIESEVKR